MKKGIFQTSALVFLSLMAFSAHSFEMKNINFFQKGETSYVQIELDKIGVKAKKFHVTEDKQIILDIEDVTADGKILRPFDTSEFSGAVVFISPYKKPGKKKDLRIAIQLRDNVRSMLKTDGNKIVLAIENRFGVFSNKSVTDGKTLEKVVAQGQQNALVHIPKSESVEDILDNLTQSGAKKYIGKKISFRVNNVTIPEILNMISISSGFNIIWDSEVTKLPPYTLNMVNVPWDQALDTVLDLGKLVANKNGNILMITTLQKATQEKKVEVEAEKLNERLEPLVTKIFPISFSELKDLSDILKDYQTGDRGTIKMDARTNNIIVKDTVDVIEKMKKIIEVLDTQTPQILIEAKVVEANEEFRQEIGLQQGLSFGYDPITPINNLRSATEDVDSGPGFTFSTAPTIGDTTRNFFGFNIAVFKRLLNLDFTLQLMESESKGKIVSSPKVIAQNNKEANLTNNDTTSFKVTTVEDGETIQSWQQISATIDLKVTPKVTNDGSIIMDVDLTKSGFTGTRPDADAPPDVNERKIKTNVLVDNGSTIVLGGLYQYSRTESHSGVPFLKDLPLLGWIFRTPFNPARKKSELIIFITPRVINQEAAGLSEREGDA
ncbi:MAG: type IV pilus secretin PilQ [Bacteriovoracaceae bacterium]|jgi:type IV pilus assembly protein PilQ|nr:type IV pilus secretin PilQ [Bacteriovoracaceae bacterium]